MNNQPEILAIIPARGNSMSIPRKNIRDFAGYPLIAFSIAAARQSDFVTRVIVSTDDDEIAAVALQYGAEVPFMRPPELAEDTTPDYPVILHALQWLAENENYHPDFVVQLRPTSPIRSKNMVDDAVRLILTHPEADSVRGVVPSMQNPYKMWLIDEKRQMKPLLEVDGIKEPYNAPRQVLKNTYWQTGHIDVIRANMILEKKSLSGNVILPLLVDPLYTVDIDSMLDWQKSERSATEGLPDMIWPKDGKRKWPEKISLLVLDFDGVLTDDRVWVNGDGEEMVAASRGDGLGLERLQQLTDIQVLIISREDNRVVAARCKKLNVPLIQSVKNKPVALKAVLKQRKIDPDEVIYIGNDLNDLECFSLAGISAAPADAYPEVRRDADLILEHGGGFGAVRELCELLIQRYKKS